MLHEEAKSLERIVSHYIRDVYLADMPFHVNQNSYQSRKSAVEEPHIVVYNIKRTFVQKQFYLGVFSDIDNMLSFSPTGFALKPRTLSQR